MDAFMLYSETPTVHMHTLKIAVIDVSGLTSGFGVNELRQVLGKRLHRLGPLRYLLLQIPFKLHHPMWQENCDVDLDHHVRALQVAAPGGRAEFNRLIGEIAGAPLARDRPLWEMYLVDGLERNRMAVVMKIHHALADGVAAANLIALGVDLTEDQQDECEMSPADATPGTVALVGSALADHWHQIRRVPNDIHYTVTGMRRMRRQGRSTHEALRPFEPPATFLNHKIDADRSFDTATLPLADVKQVAKAFEVTINDVVLAMCAGALRSLMAERGDPETALLASVPVSFGSQPGRISGNMLSGLLVSLPSNLAEPADRVRVTHSSSQTAKTDFATLGPEITSRWLEYLPPSLGERAFNRMARADSGNKVFNLAISNVAGPRERLKFGGAVITEIYSVGPLTAASALNVTVWSYVEQLNISALSDGKTFPNLHRLIEALQEAFLDIREAAGLDRSLSSVSDAMAP